MSRTRWVKDSKTRLRAVLIAFLLIAALAALRTATGEIHPDLRQEAMSHVAEATQCASLPQVKNDSQKELRVWFRPIREWSVPGSPIPSRTAPFRHLVTFSETAGKLEVRSYEFLWQLEGDAIKYQGLSRWTVAGMCAQEWNCGRLKACLVQQLLPVDWKPVWDYVESRGMLSLKDAAALPGHQPWELEPPALVIESLQNVTLGVHVFQRLKDPVAGHRLAFEVERIAVDIHFLILKPHFDREWKQRK